MKKIISLLMLVASVMGNLCAQDSTSRTATVFELPPNFAHRRFTFDLGGGNKMLVELNDMTDLDRFRNMDSVLRTFNAALLLLQDSLGDALQSRHIDYVTDSAGRRLIRIQRHNPQGSSFVVQDGEPAALKLEQDTVHFSGTVSYRADVAFRKPFTATRHYRVSFFVNDLSVLATYTDGRINRLISDLQSNVNSTWVTTHARGSAYLKAQPGITARLPKGYVAGGNYLNFRFSVDVQNYKNLFVPSFSLGAGLIISSAHFKRDLVLSWDPHFFFGNNAQGQLKTFRNDFLTLTAGQGGIRDNDPTKESHFLTILSLGYLVKREGAFFEKNTLRLGAGRLSLFSGKTKIEPVLYFTDLFKKTTPGLRWIQSF